MTLESGARWAMICLAVIAVFVALKLAEGVFAPLALALVIGIILSPVSDFLDRKGVPRQISALTTLVLGLTLLAVLVMVLTPLIADMLAQAPRIWAEMSGIIVQIQTLLRSLIKMSDEVARAMDPNSAPAAENLIVLPTVTDALSLAPSLAGQIAIFTGTLFFFLLSRIEIYTWLAQRIGPITERVTNTRKLMQAEQRVARYFLTVSMINIGLGAALAAALTALGAESAVMWGMVAALMNFIPYIGPALVVLALGVVGMVTFDGIAAGLPAAAFMVMNMLENQFITPALVGRTLSVNPLMVFLSLVFWMWLWGPLGGFVAIPLMLWVITIAQDSRMFGGPDT
ncbi:MAG: AI-2E family transporter [Paracoccaceae bacterium]